MRAEKTKKGACYKKVARAMPQNSAYRSGHMVRCPKVVAKNYNIGGKKSGGKRKKSSTSGGLRKWFSHNKGKGWVNCKTGGPCGRQSKSSGASYPACRPTMAQCKTKAGKAATRRKTSSKKVSWKSKTK